MKKYTLLFLLIFCAGRAFCHIVPKSTVNLLILERSISGEARMPYDELGNAVGFDRIGNLQDTFFIRYFTEHIRAVSGGAPWITAISAVHIESQSDPFIGHFKEVVVSFTLTPPANTTLRRFDLHYEAVVDKMPENRAIVYLHQDWRNGILRNEGSGNQVGVIEANPNGTVNTLHFDLGEGSRWKGINSMLRLGMDHIAEGTDHLLFLLVLLLPAMLLYAAHKWGGYAGLKYSVRHLLGIVTAFTVGHSVTLLISALGWIQLPAQMVEVLIAVSILVSAIHAIRPLFPGRELYVAAFFGLIHGLAFASVVSDLQLATGDLVLSIFSFNIGIEIMQLLIIALVVPWLVILSRTPVYKWVRVTGASLAGIAAIAWILQRTSGESNMITDLLDQARTYGPWCIGGIAAFSMIAWLFFRRNEKLNAPSKKPVDEKVAEV